MLHIIMNEHNFTVIALLNPMLTCVDSCGRAGAGQEQPGPAGPGRELVGQAQGRDLRHLLNQAGIN